MRPALVRNTYMLPASPRCRFISQSTKLCDPGCWGTKSRTSSILGNSQRPTSRFSGFCPLAPYGLPQDVQSDPEALAYRQYEQTCMVLAAGPQEHQDQESCAQLDGHMEAGRSLMAGKGRTAGKVRKRTGQECQGVRERHPATPMKAIRTSALILESFHCCTLGTWRIYKFHKRRPGPPRKGLLSS